MVMLAEFLYVVFLLVRHHISRETTTRSVRYVYAALANMAQLVGASAIHRKVGGSIPSQGAYERQPVDVSLSPSHLKSINIF